MRVDSVCYEVFVPSGIASRLRQLAEDARTNPVTIYTIYYIDGAVGGGHLTPKLVAPTAGAAVASGQGGK